MKEIVILSGKGGTGKTSIAGSFGVLAPRKVMVDCDVDAANLHLLLAPEIQERHQFFGLKKAHIVPEKCSSCGLCEELCRFGAVSGRSINPYLCEGCGLCYHACPSGAVLLKDTVAGEWFISSTRYGTLVHARLGIAQENSGKLVTEVRRQARVVAEREGCELIITDGPPGLGCPVIASLGGVDMALIVTEPTLSGLHDLERILDLAEHFGVKAMVCINKWDLNPENSRSIEELCLKREVDLAGRVRYDPAVFAAAVMGRPVVEVKSPVIEDILSLWDTVFNSLWNRC